MRRQSTLHTYIRRLVRTVVRRAAGGNADVTMGGEGEFFSGAVSTSKRHRLVRYEGDGGILALRPRDV